MAGAKGKNRRTSARAIRQAAARGQQVVSATTGAAVNRQRNTGGTLSSRISRARRNLARRNRPGPAAR